MKIARYFAYDSITWSSLAELPARLSRLNAEFKYSAIELTYDDEEIGVESLEAAAREVSARGVPWAYTITVQATREGESLRVWLYRKVLDGDRYHRFQIDGTTDRGLMDNLAEFLGLKPEPPTDQAKRLPKSVFVAHRFDEVGTACAEKIARFLELLGFEVSSGREFAPMPVAEKVRFRLLSQAVLICIVTQGDDPTWLTQESVLGESHQKTLILLKDQGVAFKPGLLGDREYIPFEAPAIETTFIPVLEGLRALGYLKAREGNAG